jgi:hypothetical protein
MGVTTWQPGVSPDRRINPDRRIPPSILSQEALARIIVETRGPETFAGRALQELARRRATEGDATGDDEVIIYSLRGQWLVGTVREIREAVLAAAAASCRRRASRSSPETELEAASEAADGPMTDQGWRRR